MSVRSRLRLFFAVIVVVPMTALAIAMRNVVGAEEPGYLGVMAIARHSHAFSLEEQELIDYLAGQAAVSIENASLHETVERQAVTDELTGLANTRAFHSILEREIERARRFESPLGPGDGRPRQLQARKTTSTDISRATRCWLRSPVS